jgi:Na+-transporting methylmalonyl-CoA/oxaloacetate decarboxylase gamma subunit
MSQLNLTFQITILGMGLVFGVIILLWGLINLIVKLTQKKTHQDVVMSEAEGERKKRAAIAAITIALASELDTQPHVFPLPSTVIVSAWQAVMRGKMLNKRGSVR